MKKFFPFLMLSLCITLSAIAQKNKNVPDTSMAWTTYRNAVHYGDLDVAKNACFQVITMMPENKAVHDSLAQIYFNLGAYNQAIMASEKAEPTTQLREIQAYSYRNMGNIKTALPLFETLLKESSSPEHAYQVATIQYTMKRFGECMETAGKIVNHPDAKTKKVIISTDTGENISVSYLAAAENLKGVLYLELGKKEPARVAFEKALAEAPDFTLAQKNLESIKVQPETK